MKTSVLVVEDEYIIAESIRCSLEALGYDVQHTCDGGAEAIARVALDRPDVVLMDIHLRGDLDGIDTALRLRTDFQVPVIFLTAYGDDATLDRAKRARPEGFLLKPFNERELRGAIETVLFRVGSPGPAASAATPQGSSGGASDAQDGPLTPREWDVLRLVACGLTSKEIAQHLGISPRTVESHRGHVMGKLNLRSAADLVRYAVRQSPVAS